MTADRPLPVDPWVRVLAGLDVGGRRPVPEKPLSPRVWQRVLAEARRRRLVGTLAWAVHEGRWPATDEQREGALAAHRALAARDLVLERHLLDTVDGLRSVGVDVLALKGPVLARRVYRHASSRSSRDVDLLVRGERLPEAVAALVEAGARRHFPEPRPGYDRRFTKGVALTTVDGVEIDLHRTLTAGVHGLLIDLDDLWARAETLEIGDRVVGVPDLPTLAVHAGLHAVLGEAWPQPEILRDVAATLQHPAIDLDATLRLAAAWQAETVLAYAIGATWTELGLDPAHPAAAWATSHRPPDRDLRRIRPYLLDHRDHARQAVGALWAIAGWRSRAAYLRAVVLPDAAVRGHRERWARGVAAWSGSPAATGGRP